MSKKLYVFDWDGTLADTAWRIIYCFQQAARDLSQEVPSDDAVRQCIGLDLLHTIRQLFPELTPGKCGQVQERYWHHFMDEETASVSLFEGAKETLTTLKAKGAFLAVATGKSRRGLDKDMADVGLADMFDVTVTADEAPSKPAPDMLQGILEMLSVTPEEACMIGDSDYDILMAKHANVRAIGVSYGNQSSAHLTESGANEIISSLTDLL